VIEGFLVGGLGEVVAELGVELAMVGCRVRLDGLGNLLQGGEVGGGIAIAERVVRDDVESLLEEG
jgi:hypothetical protein